MKPLFENVLVEIDKADEFENGLESVNEVSLRGTVLDVGEGTPSWPRMVCKPGDRVQWLRNAGHRVDFEGKECIVLNERKGDIILKL